VTTRQVSISLDGLALFRVDEKHGLEGVVSKCRDAPYWSGVCRY